MSGQGSEVNVKIFVQRDEHFFFLSECFHAEEELQGYF